MSTNTVSGSAGASDIGQVVQRLVAAPDKRQAADDPSSSEFGSVLTGLIGAVPSRGSGPDRSARPAVPIDASRPAALASPDLSPALSASDRTK